MDVMQQIRKRFGNDRFAALAGIEILEAEPGRALCRLVLRDEHMNSNDTPMGGAIFTLADFAFAVAANFDNIHTVSLASSISFLSVAKGSVLTAKAKCIKDGRSSCVFAVDIFDDLGTNVAYVTINGFRMNNPVSK